MLSGKKWKKISEYTLIPFPSLPLPQKKKTERKKKWKKDF